MDLLPLIGTGAGVLVSFVGVMRWLLRDLRADLGGRIDRLETRLDGRMDRLEARLDGRMDQLEARLDGRMDQLEGRIDGLAADLRTVSADLRTVSDRVARVEGAVCGPWPGRPDTADAPPS